MAEPDDAPRQPLKGLSPKRLAKFNEANARKGVCYIARVPPFLKPAKLRHLLEGFGTDVLRIYCAPEEKALRARRLRAGGNKKQMFSEGWVEFAEKRVAKQIASSLNNTPIGGSKRSFYAHDLWNIKYLSKFKWDDLTEKIAYERKVREQKLRLELAQAKRENAFYMQKVTQAKAIDAMAERKRSTARPAPDVGHAAAAGAAAAEAGTGVARARRTFAQKPVLRPPTARDAPVVGTDVLARVLSSGRRAEPDAPAPTATKARKRRHGVEHGLIPQRAKQQRG
ncbi:hypothetical protein KFE25_010227 [Diacronema lutheri]|uniref:RRM domain-containing protein n=1 Tax=Diacronema lutheri TaxID=2081491 RepID=A0A8J6C9S3_DIALT|nr:hypothetical protein KFE25_010227 [Diacronema lutheri]